jgi:hypothetical protein
MSDSQLLEIVGVLCLFIGFGGLLAIRRVISRQHEDQDYSFGFGAFQHIQQRVESSIVRFRQEVRLYNQRCELLDVYTPEYFNTFQLAGWNEFKQLLEDLDYADSKLDSLMQSGEFEEAETLVNMLLGVLSPEELERAMRNFQSLAHLSNWRNDAADGVVRLVRGLEEAATETKELGVSRQRSRKPTLLAINELQTLLPN